MAWRCAKAAPRRGSRLNTATNCAQSVACTAGAKAWSAMLPVPKRAIPRDIVSVSFCQAGGVLGRRVSRMHGRDTYAEKCLPRHGSLLPPSRTHAITVLNSVAFQTKGGEGFSRRSGLQKKPPEMHIFLR